MNLIQVLEINVETSGRNLRATALRNKFQQGVVVCNVVGFVELFWTFVVRQVFKAELFA